MKEQLNCNKETFHIWLEAQPRKIRNQLRELVEMCENDRVMHLSSKPSVLHDKINEVFDERLNKLYELACLDERE